VRKLNRIYLGKPNGKSPHPILARFLRYSDRQKVLELRRSKLKGRNYAVYEEIPKELYDLRKAQMSKFKEAKRRGLKAILVKLSPIVCILVANLSQQTILFFTFDFVFFCI